MKKYSEHNRAVFFIIAFSLLLVLLLIKGRDNASVLGLDTVTEEESAQYCSGRIPASDPRRLIHSLRFCGVPLAYDSERNCCYITQNMQRQDYSGTLTTEDPDTQIWLVRNGKLNDKASAIAEGTVFSLYIADEKEYAALGLIFTGLPVIHIQDQEGTAPDDQYTLSDIFLSDPGSSCSSCVNATACQSEYRISTTGETISVKLLKKDQSHKKKDLLHMGNNAGWKLYSISDTDDSRVRSMLSARIWNTINTDDRLQMECRYVAYFYNDSFQGLRILEPEINKNNAALREGNGQKPVVTKTEQDGSGQIPGADNGSEYLLFLQVTDAVKNCEEDFYRISFTGGETYSVMPGKMEYAFGTFPGRYEYMSWNAPVRMIGQDSYSGNFGIDFGTYLEMTKSRWSQIRTEALSNDRVMKIIRELADYLKESGAFTVLDEEERAEASDDTDRLISYLCARLERMDLFYGTSDPKSTASSDSGEWEGTVEQESQDAPVPAGNPPNYIDVRATVDSIGNAPQQSVKLLLKEQDCYILLPSYCYETNTVLTFSENLYQVAWNGEEIRSGGSVAIHDGNAGDVMTLTNLVSGEKADYSVHVLRSSGIASVYIETANGTTDWMDYDKTHKEPGTFLCIDSKGELDCACRISKMHARGSTTFDYGGQGYKHSYTLHLAEDTDVLSMGAARKWILQSNNHDAMKVRNAAALALSDRLKIGYTPQYAYADVYLNGEYAGNYMVMEAIEVSDERVDIAGGNSCLLSIDRAGKDGITLSTDGFNFIDFNVLYPAPENLTDEKLHELQERLNKIEDLIDRSDDPDAYEELSRQTDIDSFARMYILHFLTNETDSNAYSTFYYIDGKDGLLHAGPVWDYDRAWGNDNDGRGIIDGLNAYRDGLPEFLADRNDDFRSRIKNIIDTEDFGNFLTDFCRRTSAEIANSVSMDSLVWGYVSWSGLGSTAEEGNRLYTQIEKRAELLRDILHNRERYCKIRMHIDDLWDIADTYWAVRGTKMPQEVIDSYMDHYMISGLCTKGGTPVTADYIITHDTETYGAPIWEQDESDG